MKINCGLTAEEREARKRDWHRHFALWPVRLASGDCRWLETVERKGTYHLCLPYPEFSGWSWEYRPIGGEK